MYNKASITAQCRLDWSEYNLEDIDCSGQRFSHSVES